VRYGQQVYRIVEILPTSPLPSYRLAKTDGAADGEDITLPGTFPFDAIRRID